uniref:Uncharacterized protein n=1 Tax=Globisporangium ultimum (strain ATCC 200006 / CBS 805.95 / DAOM BR144) TaxID=431595 RepID=K3X8U9_GLOUD
MAAMRVRLRAPEEDAADTLSAAAGLAVTDTPWATLSREQQLVFASTAPQPPLPHLDLRSPEYIEERLENLKRKPTWRAWLDQYVQDHPDSDGSDDEDDAVGGRRIDKAAKRARYTRKTPGFLKTTCWSVIIAAFTPLLLLLYPCLRRKDNWPLGCTSLPGLIAYAFSTLVCIAFSIGLIYWTICRELPELNRNAWTNLQVRFNDMAQMSETCQASIFQYDLTLFQELCMPLVIDAALLSINVALLFQSHHKWARYALLAMAAAFVVDTPTKLYNATFPAPDITNIDPSYALADEELLVTYLLPSHIALEGKNLKPGGSVAWVAYWGCASTASVDACEKQFPSSFEVGVARVTFTAIDHFIPCYRDPPNPLKAQEYRCFEHVRLRVKDKQSIPGWSKRTAAIYQTTGKQRIEKVTTDDEQQGAEKSANYKESPAETKRSRSSSSSGSRKKSHVTATLHVASDGDILAEE